MVSNVTSLTNNGLRDWLFQRVSALVIGIYTIFIVAYIGTNPGLDFSTWKSLFTNTAMRIASTIVIMNIVIHAWVGLWTVATDYLKCAALRGGFLMAVLLIELILLFWGIAIIWGI